MIISMKKQCIIYSCDLCDFEGKESDFTIKKEYIKHLELEHEIRMVINNEIFQDF